MAKLESDELRQKAKLSQTVSNVENRTRYSRLEAREVYYELVHTCISFTINAFLVYVFIILLHVPIYQNLFYLYLQLLFDFFINDVS